MVIIFKKLFLKELRRMPKYVQVQAKEVIDILHEAKNLFETKLDYTPMEGQKKGDNYYRIRIGGYRLGIEIVEPDCIIFTICSRGDIYKTFPPK